MSLITFGSILNCAFYLLLNEEAYPVSLQTIKIESFATIVNDI